ncbi:MAG: AraC family transcriptional regulator [Nevskiaceae bacterium]|nr:MAG: AraC family transcriptional regulator [Nevskiaceae bacterium]
MPAPEIRRSIVSVQILAQFAASHGMALEDCLRGTGIDAGALANPQTEILATQELQLVRNLVRAVGHKPGIGLDAGLQYHLSAYGIWGFALVTSPNFRSAAAIATQFLDLSYAFVRFRLGQTTDQVYQLKLDDSEIPADVRQFLFERDLGAWANAMREMRPSHLPVVAAEFRFPKPVYAERYAELCGVMPRFDAAENVIAIDPAHIDDPLSQSDSGMARLCLEQCKQLLEKRRVRSGVASRVRDRLLRAPSEMPGIEEVARDLHMAPRSLRRRLEEENTSFRALVEEVRQMLAEEFLAMPGMKLEEIAMRLGYAEPASFIHAFKRWKGVPPHAFRTQSG